MNRRAFIQRLGGTVIGLMLSRTLPGIAGAPPRMPFTPESSMAFDDRGYDVGDVVTVEGRYAMHPQTWQPTSILQQCMMTDVVSGPDNVRCRVGG